MLRAPDAELLFATERRRLVESCRRCGGTGKIARQNPDDPDDPFRPIERCVCLDEVALRCKLAEGNVPEEFWSVERIQFEFNISCLKRIQAYCRNLQEARADGHGFVLCGENGAGKTSMATLILLSALRAGFSIGYLTTQEYLSTIIPASHDAELADWFRQVQTADFLVLDELGKESRKEGEGSEFWLASLDSLIRQRCQNLRPTILISNFPAYQVKKVYGDSFASILASRTEYLTFEPGDFRIESARRRRKQRREGEE